MAVGCVRTKEGVSFATIAPAGFRILSALEAVARSLGYDLTITSACDGLHSGPEDFHHKGQAYDIRTKTLGPNMKEEVLRLLLLDLCEHAEVLQPMNLGGNTGFVTSQFFAQLENRGQDGEHIHCQLRQGHTYPPVLRTIDPKVTTV